MWRQKSWLEEMRVTEDAAGHLADVIPCRGAGIVDKKLKLASG
jgi:hypothetical protein